MKAYFRAKTVEEQIEALSHVPDEQMPSASINARLIRDLSLVYDHQSYARQFEHSLQQVEQRLQAQQTQQRNNAGSIPQPFNSNRPDRLPSTRKREQPQRILFVSQRVATALGPFAALLCVIALIGGLIFTFQATQHHGKALGTPLPATLTTSNGKAVALQSIHMFNAGIGWAITAGNKRILHTTTGVTHWQDVSPAPLPPSDVLAGTDFFSPTLAWVVMASEAGAFVYRTHDGGQHWQKAPIPDQIIGNCRVTFLNTSIGWLFIGKGAATGSEAVDVLHTSNGGATWKVISVTSFTHSTPKALPLEGDKFGISFVNPTTGWATGLSTVSNSTWLYMTHDSGVTWQHQSIPLAGNTGNNQIAVMSPIFFTATDGVLPVVFAGLTTQTTIIYVTGNGGENWNATTPVPIGASAQSIDFADAAHGWIANNTDDAKSDQYVHSTLYRTSDSGQHWTQYTIKLSADIIMLDFTSPTLGWAIDSRQELYQTSDGGQTWTKVIPIAT